MNRDLHNLNVFPSAPGTFSVFNGWNENTVSACDHLYYVERGCIFAIVDGQSFIVPAHHVLLIPIDISYTVWHPDSVETLIYYFEFIARENDEDIFRRHALDKGDLVIRDDAGFLLNAYHNCMTDRRFSNSITVRINRTAQIASVISFYFEARARMRESLRTFAPAVAYMEAHFREEITNEQLGSIMGMNPSYFCTAFGNAMGITPKRYLSQLRIREATRLMRDTDLSLAKIAEQIGIDNVYYMKKFFIKTLSIPPEQYRAHILPPAKEKRCQSDKNA